MSTTDNNFALDVFNTQKSDQIFCVDSSGDSVTYNDLESSVRKFAHLLKSKHGVVPGTRVAMALEDTVHWPVTFLAIILLGANPVLLFSNMVKKDMDFVLTSSDAQLIVSDHPESTFKSVTTKELIDSKEEHTAAHNWDDERPCWWALSSGSGGSYKIIVHNHASFKKLYTFANTAVGVSSSDVVLCTAKMSFPYGLAQMYWVLKNGATLCLIEKTPAPSLVFRMIKRHSVTRLNVGPYLLNAMCASKNKFDLTGTKIICSGEYLSDDLRAKVKQHLGSSVYDTYGATEVWTTISFQNDPATNDAGEILDGVETKIVDGELYIKHPVQAMGYWNAPELTRKVFQKDWVATGDSVEITNNRIKFLGRVDNMIKIKGTFVSLLDIEDAIRSCPNVDECIVVVAHNGAIQNLLAKVKFVSKDPGVSALRKHLRTILPSDKIPKHIEQVSELPKTNNNKLKRELAKLQK